jgi:hypothetical protein
MTPEQITDRRGWRGVVHALRRTAGVPLTVTMLIAVIAAIEGQPFPLNALYGMAGTWGAFAAGYIKAMDDNDAS